MEGAGSTQIVREGEPFGSWSPLPRSGECTKAEGRGVLDGRSVHDRTYLGAFDVEGDRRKHGLSTPQCLPPVYDERRERGAIPRHGDGKLGRKGLSGRTWEA